jgi:uncharacterized cupin superfamily protein
MSAPQPSNIWDAQLDGLEPGIRGARLLERPPGTRLVSAVWELDPGVTGPHYHVHHGVEELLVVVEGRPVLRTPDGERVLERGDVVHFPVGAGGAHQVINRTGSVARYLMVAAARTGMDAVEYVDEGEVVVYSHESSLVQEGSLFFTHQVEPPA